MVATALSQQTVWLTMATAPATVAAAHSTTMAATESTAVTTTHCSSAASVKASATLESATRCIAKRGCIIPGPSWHGLRETPVHGRSSVHRHPRRCEGRGSSTAGTHWRGISDSERGRFVEARRIGCLCGESWAGWASKKAFAIFVRMEERVSVVEGAVMKAAIMKMMMETIVIVVEHHYRREREEIKPAKEPNRLPPPPWRGLHPSSSIVIVGTIIRIRRRCRIVVSWSRVIRALRLLRVTLRLRRRGARADRGLGRLR